MADDTAGTDPPADDPPFGASEKALALVLLAGSLALAYVCLDVLAGGRITGAITRRGAA